MCVSAVDERKYTRYHIQEIYKSLPLHLPQTSTQLKHTIVSFLIGNLGDIFQLMSRILVQSFEFQMHGCASAVFYTSLVPIILKVSVYSNDKNATQIKWIDSGGVQFHANMKTKGTFKSYFLWTDPLNVFLFSVLKIKHFCFWHINKFLVFFLFLTLLNSQVECYDYDNDGSHDLIGTFETTMTRLKEASRSSPVWVSVFIWFDENTQF